jgi:adenylate cyclase
MAGHAWLIPFCGGDGTLPRLSFVTALKGGAALKTLKGTIVLVGSTRPIQHDFFSVPLPRRRTRSGTFEELGSNTMAGIEIHGQALSALLEKRSIVPVGPSMRWFLFGLLALLGTTLTIFPMKPVASLGLWLLLGVTIGAGGIVAMLHGRPLPLLGLSLTWLAYAGTSFSYHRYLDFRERKAVEKLFSRYVSPNIARVLLARPDLVHLGGRRKVLSILFADIRGFTSLSERLPPEVVSALLNEYFTEMTDVLFEFDGTLDKFIGDAVLAFFGDPVDQEDHPARAMACAVAMQKRAAALRDRFESDGKPAIHVGIAVHTGPVVVGNNGSADNFDYTVIGDAVNLASRLQALATADDVITTIRTIENIYEFKTRYAYEEMPPVQVRGKSEPIAIARVLGTVQ